MYLVTLSGSKWVFKDAGASSTSSAAKFRSLKQRLVHFMPSWRNETMLNLMNLLNLSGFASFDLCTLTRFLHVLWFVKQGVCGCDRFSSSSIGNVIQTIVKKDGYRGLLRGWIPRMLFHAPAAAICWSTYEASKAFFQQLNSSYN